jgi:hypothetical protein
MDGLRAVDITESGNDRMFKYKLSKYFVPFMRQHEIAS